MKEWRKMKHTRTWAILAWTLGSVLTVHATAYTWQGGNASWDVGVNWNPNGLPVAADTASVTNPATISLNGNRSILGISVGRTPDTGNYTFNASGNTLTVGAGGVTIIGDSAGSRTYTFNNGFTLSAPSAFNLAYEGSGNRNHAIHFGPIDTAGHDLLFSFGWASSGTGYSFNGAISGAGNVTLLGRTTYGTVYFKAANSFTGSLLLRCPTRVLILDGSGALTATKSIAAIKGCSFDIGTTSSNLADEGLVGSGAQGRILNDATVSLRQSGMNLVGRNSSHTTEAIGDLRIGDGYAWVDIKNGTSATATGRVVRVVRDADSPGVLYARSGNNNLGNGSHLIVADGGASLSLIGGNNTRGTDRAIVPFAVGRSKATDGSRPNTFLRYDAAAGFVPLDPVTEFVNATATEYYTTFSFPAVDPDGYDNVRLPHMPFSGDKTLRTLSLPAGNTTINSLFVDADATVSTIASPWLQIRIQGGDSLTVRSGALAMSGTTSACTQPRTELNVPTVYFGVGGTGVEGVLTYFGNGNVGRWVVNSSLVGDRGLTLYHSSNAQATEAELYGESRGLKGLITISGGGTYGLKAKHLYAIGDGTNDIYLANNTRLVPEAAISGGKSLTVRSLAGHGSVVKSLNLNVGGDGSGGTVNTLKLLQDGRIAPGDPEHCGTLTLSGFSTVALEGGTLEIDLRTPIPTFASFSDPQTTDRLAITGTNPALTLAGTTLAVTLHGPVTVGDTFLIVGVAGSTASTGAFANGTQVQADFGNQRFVFNILTNSNLAGGDGNDIVLQVVEVRSLNAGTVVLVR